MTLDGAASFTGAMRNYHLRLSETGSSGEPG